MAKQSDRVRNSNSGSVPAASADASSNESAIGSALIRDALVVVLGALAVLAWIAAHLGESWGGAAGLVFVISGIALGLASPIAALVLAICTVPFQGGPIGEFVGAFGVSEFARGAPVWGAVIRTLADLVRRGRESDAPPRLLLFAAIASIVLAPLTRLPSEAYPAYQSGPTGIFVDMLAIIGTQSLMWGGWILASHLPRNRIPAIERAIALVLPVAMLIALIAFAQIPLFQEVAFAGDRYGRLSALGFPTPTAMGIAVALPIAAMLAWRQNRIVGSAIVALGLFVIYLTGSRGPLIASVASGVAAVLVAREVPRRIILLGGAAGGVAAAALAVQRYGEQFADWLSGKSVEIVSLSDSMRIQSWIAAFQIALAKPLTGAGWMSLRFWNKEFEANKVAESHNIVLLALAAGGIPYALSTGIGVVGSAVLMWRSRNRLPIEWLGAAVALLVCGLWDMPQTRALAALYGGIALGVVSRRTPIPPVSS